MELHYTPRSHFSRKVRLLLAALELNVELVDVGNVADDNPKLFASNPLMKVPVLVHQNNTIFDSDHIAIYLSRHLVPNDPFHVLTSDAQLLNARAVMNGIMNAEVSLILAKRTGIQVENLQRFKKLKASIIGGLQWLESQRALFSKQPSYTCFHLVSMWDHLALYDMVPLPYPQLKALVEQLSEQDYVAASKPT